MLNFLISLVLFVLLACMVGFAKVTGVSTGIKGKVGNVVYAGWKGIQVMKTRSIPNNPKTAAQTTQRTFFKENVEAFKSLSSGWIRQFWKLATSQYQTTWSKFLKENMLEMDGTFDIKKAILSQGSLYPLSNAEATYDSATGELRITFDDDIGCSGALTDNVSVCVFFKAADKPIACALDSATREDGLATVELATGLTSTDLIVFINAAQKDSNDVVTSVSNSQQLTPTDA